MAKHGLSEGTLHEQLTDSSKSAYGKYQDLALGTNSFWYLFKYELIMLIASWVPGALGLVLRKCLYPFILGQVGRNVVFGQGVAIRHGQKITIGDNVIVDDGAVLDAKGGTNNGISIGDDTIISRNVVLSCKNSDISIGKSCAIGINSLIHALEGSDVFIGDNVLVGAFCYFIGGGNYATEDVNLLFKEQGSISKGGIRVSGNVWFGSNVQVMDGVTIDEGAIVGASAVVTKKVEKLDVVAGVPAKKIKSRIK